MTGDRPTMAPAVFAELYDRRPDPWGLEESWYEDRKRDAVLAALPDPRYHRAFEPGCANGALSVRLAARCDELLCWEPVPRAVAAARRRAADLPGLRVERGDVPRTWPDGRFDLVVIGEVAYYLGDADRARLWDRVVSSLEHEGVLVAVHWLGEVPDYPVGGDRVHDELARVEGLAPIVSHREADFRLDVLVRGPSPARSVAQRSGLR